MQALRLRGLRRFLYRDFGVGFHVRCFVLKVFSAVGL